EIRPGELVVVDDDGYHAVQAVPQNAEGALCIFEFFYLARPDSQLAGVEVHSARVRMGERLAEEAPVEADLVLPVPDGGTPAAIGFSRATGIPFSEGLIKNRYVGRTFIQPDQGLRQQGVKLKSNPLAEVKGKRIVAVDDTIVRGNTTQHIEQMPFEAGAAEARVDVLPRMPDAGLPHGSPARGDEAAVRENSGLGPTAPARGSPSRSRG